jgi:glycosyltransferase involved in cell wall biosynthesis
MLDAAFMDGARAPRRRGHRLLLVLNHVEPGGAERQAMHLAAGLSRRGHDVTLLALGFVRCDVGVLRDAGVRVSSLGAVGPRARLAALPALTRLARGADLVHCTNWDASLYGRLAALLARRPVIVTDHTGDRAITVSRGGAPRARWVAAHHRLLGRLTVATVYCARVQEDLLTSEGVPRDRLVHIPNGIPVESIRAAAASGLTRADLGLPDGARVLIHVANFRPEKNQAQTLATVAALRQQGADVRAVFVGGGAEEESVRRQAAQMDADSAVFLGRRQDVPALLGLADLLVLPSRAETMPMVVLEAMAAGLPVVAYDVGDVRRVLREGGGGICVERLDGGAFTEACRRVLEDPGLADELGRRGLAASAGFDADGMVRRYEEVIDAALAPATAPLRILHVGPDAAGRGGIPAVISDLLTSSLADRHQLDFVATYGSATYERVARRKLLITFARGLVRVLWWSLGSGTRVVHVHTAVGGSWYRKAVCVVAVRATRRPVILHVHSGAGAIAGFAERLGPVRLGLIARAFRAADRVVTVSRASAAEIERWLGVRDIVVVPNATRLPSSAATTDRSSGGVRMLYLGGFANPAKGGRVLAEALPAVLAAAPQVSVSLAGLGSPPPLDEVAGSVEWLGWLDTEQVTAALIGADIVVVPSLSEGLPLALLDALGHGKAVVAASAGGIPEAITDGVDGVLVAPGDATALARAISALVLDPARRAQLGRAARARAERASGGERYDRLEELYLEVAKRRPVRSAEGLQTA